MSDSSQKNLPEPGDNPPDPAKAARFRQIFQNLQDGSAGTNVEQFEAAVLELLGIAAEQADQNPLPEDDLAGQIEAAEARFDWKAALELRKARIEIEKQAKDSLLLYPILVRLSELLQLLGRAEEAMSIAEEALAVARREDLPAALAYTAQNAARCALALKQPDRALQFIEQAVAAFGPLEGLSFGRGRLTAAKNLLIRARCQWARGDLAAAEADLAVAWSEFQRLSESEFMGGIPSRVADCWELAGLIHHRKGEIDEALESLQRALEQRKKALALDDYNRHIAIHLLARTFHEYSQVLAAAGADSTAELARQAVRELCEFVRLPPPVSSL